jgi:hypothetical protein
MSSTFRHFFFLSFFNYTTISLVQYATDNLRPIFTDFTDSVFRHTLDYILKLSKSRMRMCIKSPHKEVKLKIMSHFVDGGYPENCTKSVKYIDKIDILYAPHLIKRGFKGEVVCQLQDKSGHLEDRFVMVGWEVPIFGAPKTYAIVADTNDYKIK